MMKSLQILAAAAALALAGGCRSTPYVPPAPASPGQPASAADAATETEEPAASADAASADAASAEETPEAEAYDNTVKWSTASELDNFGFDVFRSESEDGPFERLNAEIIEGGGTVDEPRHYQFVDDTIDPRMTYYYYVESISMSGVRERFTPVGKAPPKLEPEAQE